MPSRPRPSGFRAGSSPGQPTTHHPSATASRSRSGRHSPSYIYYAERTFGVNLDWSATPRFDWQLLGGKTGQEVRSGDWLALYNQTARDCLIYFDRTVGGDIGWPSSETWTDEIEDVVMQAIRDHWKEAVAYLLSE